MSLLAWSPHLCHHTWTRTWNVNCFPRRRTWRRDREELPATGHIVASELLCCRLLICYGSQRKDSECCFWCVQWSSKYERSNILRALVQVRHFDLVNLYDATAILFRNHLCFLGASKSITLRGISGLRPSNGLWQSMFLVVSNAVLNTSDWLCPTKIPYLPFAFPSSASNFLSTNADMKLKSATHSRSFYDEVARQWHISHSLLSKSREL